MKLAIGSNIKKGPWGGGNNFVSNLADFLKKKNCEVFFDLKEKNLDIILLTDPRPKSQSASFDHFDIYNYIKKINPKALVVHRINECDERKSTKGVNDSLLFANNFSDFTIFISTWLLKLFSNLKQFKNCTVIYNGANKKIFFDKKHKNETKGKFKIVTHHWSNHFNKGFDIYKLIDNKIAEDINFKNKIDFTFIGNLPEKNFFSNINYVEPLCGIELADEIRKNDAYITGSRNEPGGNHQNEAINCGLPVLYLNSGCMKEYCEGYGLEYKKENLFEKIQELILKYEIYKNKMPLYKINSDKTCSDYYELFKKLISNREKFVEERRWPKIPLYKFLKKKLQRL